MTVGAVTVARSVFHEGSVDVSEGRPRGAFHLGRGGVVGLWSWGKEGGGCEGQVDSGGLERTVHLGVGDVDIVRGV